MKKMISSLFAAMMVISILPLCVQAEEAVNDVITEAADEVFEAEEDVSNEAFQDIAGTSSGNETIVDDAFMNVWLGILFNGYYEYRTYIDDNCDEVFEIRLVPEEGYVMERFYAENQDGEVLANEDGVLLLKGNCSCRSQYWVEGRTEQERHAISVVSPEDISYTVFVNRQKADDRARTGEMVTVTAIPDEDAGYTGMSARGVLSGEQLAETEELFFTFLMPDEDVRVVIQGSEKQSWPITAEAITHGTVRITVNGTETSSAYRGNTVSVSVVPEEGCAVLGLHLIDEEGNSTFFGEKGEGTFVMPEGSVRVEADFISTECENGSFLSAELHDDGGGLFYNILSCGIEHYIGKEITAVYTDGQEQVFPSMGTGMTKVTPRDKGSLMTISFQENPNDIKYTDENGNEYWADQAVDLKDEGNVLTGGWYVLSQDKTVCKRIEIQGDVNLILCDGCTLTAWEGVHNSEGNSLTIWPQRQGTGKLYCAWAHDDYQAALGGNDGENGGRLVIHGGNVVADATKEDAASIGGGRKGNGGNILIYGGYVKNQACGAMGGGAGIGGGSKADGGMITIYGGTIDVKGHNGNYVAGAGIGGGDEGDSGDIRIYGGNITAVGGGASWSGAGAGIGGGDHGQGARITIGGGTINARGGQSFNYGSGAGIGGGNEGDGRNIQITGGTVNAFSPKKAGLFSDDWGAGVGGGDNADGSYIEITGGCVDAHGYEAFGKGKGGDNSGQLLLGDTIWAADKAKPYPDGWYPYSERYSLARNTDMRLAERLD